MFYTSSAKTLVNHRTDAACCFRARATDVDTLRQQVGIVRRATVFPYGNTRQARRGRALREIKAYWRAVRKLRGGGPL
ncbi:hypothetical protein [Massilia terrae]|uniref:Uncharacterized protein n=1 Tax=Massilia terrae TaxID=1811224 RepID=A0ABT2CXV2_9BURK|nr:hypothetical protein [Massilia terrae]MCS0658630.1 hypothetical protein [Massilia terrae]